MNNSSYLSYALLHLVLAVGITGCAQTVDRPPIRLPQAVGGSVAPAPEPRVPVSSGLAIESAVRALAQDLVSKAPAVTRTKRIAVLPMRDLTGSSGALTVTANHAFRVELFRAASFQFVADSDMRRAIEQLGNEKELRKNGNLDRETLSSLYKLVSAELFIDSQITDSFTEYRLTAEIIEISTGRMLANASHLLPKSVINGASADLQSLARRQVGRVLSAGDDWLQTSLASVRSDKGQIVRAKFIFFNRSQSDIRLALKDPQRRAYLVDGRGASFAFFGTEGFDSRGEIIIRPETRHEVDILFTSSEFANGPLTMRTAWYARGIAKADQEFVVRDIVVSR